MLFEAGKIQGFCHCQERTVEYFILRSRTSDAEVIKRDSYGHFLATSRQCQTIGSLSFYYARLKIHTPVGSLLQQLSERVTSLCRIILPSCMRLISSDVPLLFPLQSLSHISPRLLCCQTALPSFCSATIGGSLSRFVCRPFSLKTALGRFPHTL